MSYETTLKKLGITEKTPDLYKVLGLHLNVPPSEIEPRQITTHYIVNVQPFLEHINEDTVKLIKKAHNILSDSQRKVSYDAHIFPKLNQATHTPDPSLTTIESIERFSIRNPAVMLGAAVMAGIGIMAGISATSQIRAKKEEDKTPSPSDHIQQIAGYGTAVAVITAAAMMWHATGKAR